MFLYDWYLESVHKEYFFYLLTFSVPFWVNAAINPEDATRPILVAHTRQRVQSTLELQTAEEELDQLIAGNVEINDREANPLDASEETAEAMRFWLLIIFVLISVQAILFGLINLTASRMF